MTQRVWGYVCEGEATLAAYYVEWTPGHDEPPATFDFIVGPWGDASSRAERKAICLHLRKMATGPEFMVVDATNRPIAKSELVGEALRRDQVIGHPIAQKIFDLCDAVWLDDPRIAPLRS